MFAIIETGSKQYKVKVGTVLEVEKLSSNKKDVVFDKVLLINNNDEEILFGKPFLENAVVKAELVKEYQDKKIVVFKFKRKTGYKRTHGHRQELTKVKITEILPSGVKETVEKAKVAKKIEESVASEAQTV